MTPTARRRKARPERIRVSLFDDSAGALPIPLPSRVLGWSVGVVILFLLTILFLFYGESARITRDRLVHVPRLGPLKIHVEYDLFVRGWETTGPDTGAQAALADLFVPLWPALLALVCSHGVSFYANFLGRKEYIGRTVQEQMAEPYKRIIVMHLTIIFGGWLTLLLRSPVPALILLIALKTAVDLRAHRREHGEKAP